MNPLTQREFKIFFKLHKETIPTLPKTNSKSLKNRSSFPKGKDRFPTIHFRGATSYFPVGYLIEKTNGRPTINQSQSMILLSFGPQNHET